MKRLTDHPSHPRRIVLAPAMASVAAILPSGLVVELFALLLAGLVIHRGVRLFAAWHPRRVSRESRTIWAWFGGNLATIGGASYVVGLAATRVLLWFTAHKAGVIALVVAILGISSLPEIDWLWLLGGGSEIEAGVSQGPLQLLP